MNNSNLLIVTASMSAMSIGIAYGWSSPILPQLLKPGSIIPMTPDESSWIVVCLELGSLFTAFPAGLILDKFGRKNVLLFCAPILVLSWLLVIFTRSVSMLYLSKLLQGSCMGIVLCSSPIYITEISQPNIRGVLSITIVSMWYIGFILEYTIGSYTSYDNTAYISLVLSTLYIIPLAFQPESPCFYVLKNRLNDATKSLSYFRNVSPSQLSDEIKSLEEYVKEEKQNETSVFALFRDPISVRCLFIMEIICCTTILTGLTATYAYATQIFSKTSQGSFSAEEYSIMISVLFLIMNLIASALIDRTGRRILVLVSCVGCFFSNLFAAIFFYTNSETEIDVSSYHWVPLVVIGGYCTFVSIGLSPLATIFQGELFPSNTRSIASGFTALSIAIMSSFCLKVYFLIDTYIGTYFNYVVFTFFAGLGTVILYIYMPETKDKTFAQIQRELNLRYNKIDVKDKQVIEPLNQ